MQWDWEGMRSTPPPTPSFLLINKCVVSVRGKRDEVKSGKTMTLGFVKRSNLSLRSWFSKKSRDLIGCLEPDIGIRNFVRLTGSSPNPRTPHLRCLDFSFFLLLLLLFIIKNISSNFRMIPKVFRWHHFPPPLFWLS